MKKVLVVGSKGMAGHVMRHVLDESNLFKVIDISREGGNSASSFKLDLTNLEGLNNILVTEKPNVVINCVGILNESAEANPERSIFINSFIPHFLATRCSRLIHISTDCVFSGLRGNYLENDIKEGQGYYSASKALGEVVYGSHLTLRTSIIGPELKSDGRGLLHWFFNQQGQVKGYSQALWSGVTTLQLAMGILDLIDRPDIKGLVHYTNNTKISKLNLLRMIAIAFDKKIAIEPYEDYHVDKSLLNTRTDIDLEIPDYETMIKDLAKFIQRHSKEMYTHYNL